MTRGRQGESVADEQRSAEMEGLNPMVDARAEDLQHFLRGQVEEQLQVPPLRFASVGMRQA